MEKGDCIINEFGQSASQKLYHLLRVSALWKRMIRRDAYKNLLKRIITCLCKRSSVSRNEPFELVGANKIINQRPLGCYNNVLFCNREQTIIGVVVFLWGTNPDRIVRQIHSGVFVVAAIFVYPFRQVLILERNCAFKRRIRHR